MKTRDDFKDNYLPNLQKSLLYLKLNEKCGDEYNEVTTLVQKAVEESVERSKLIIRHMGEFTLHDSVHLFRLLNIIEKILGEENIDNLSIAELELIILSVFFHDLGMAPKEEEINVWKEFLLNIQVNAFNKHLNPELNNFTSFWHSRGDIIDSWMKTIHSGDFVKISNNQTYIISEFIRVTHANRVREIIDKEWKGKILFKNVNLELDLANICESHNFDAKLIKNNLHNKSVGNDEYACLPLIAILLRLSDILDFDSKRAPKVLFDNLYIKNIISKSEWSKHQAIQSWTINNNCISFTAQCEHPVIQYSILEFCNIIEQELSICNSLIAEINQINKNLGRNLNIILPYLVDTSNIEPIKDIHNNPKYIFRKTKFELSKKQILDLLMGEKLYGNPEYALRELVQNSIDACKLRKDLSFKWEEENYIPKIEINYYFELDKFVLEVNDNGIGMDNHIIENYYSKIGNSYYKSSEYYKLKHESGSNYIPISRFGIGVLSCFMISDTINLETRRINGVGDFSEPLNLIIEGQDSIFYTVKSERKRAGTGTKLILRPTTNPWATSDFENFKRQLKSLFLKPEFEINVSFHGNKFTIVENDFHTYDFSLLRNYRAWNQIENIRIFNISFNSAGISMRAEIAILQQYGFPCTEVKGTNKMVGNFNIEKKIKLQGQNIVNESNNLTLTDNSDLVLQTISHGIFLSNALISYNGIEIPHNIFDFNKKANLAYLNTPFPILALINITEPHSIELNSARTEIIQNENWDKIKLEISIRICYGLKSQMEINYWNKFVEINNEIPSDSIFKEGLNIVALNEGEI